MEEQNREINLVMSNEEHDIELGVKNQEVDNTVSKEEYVEIKERNTELEEENKSLRDENLKLYCIIEQYKGDNLQGLRKKLIDLKKIKDALEKENNELKNNVEKNDEKNNAKETHQIFSQDPNYNIKYERILLELEKIKFQIEKNAFMNHKQHQQHQQQW